MASTENSQQLSIADALAIAKQHHQNGDLAKAAALYKSILRAVPKHADASYLYGLVEYRMGRPQAAQTLILQAIDIDPSNALAIASYAQILFDQENYRDARQYFFKAHQLKPDNTNIANGLGLCHMRLGEFNASREIFLEALQQRPKAFYPRFNLAGLENKLGNASRALELYQKCEDDKPNDPALHNCIGAVLFSQRRFEQASTAFERVIDLQSGSAEAHNNLGAIYMQRKQYALALQQFRCSLSLWSAFGQAHVNAALALQLMGCTDEAKQTIGLAERIMSDDDPLPPLVECFLELRQIYQSEQQIVEARKAYTQNLNELVKFTRRLDKKGRRSLEHIIGYTQPFYLPYQGQNDKQLQSLYGASIDFPKTHDRALPELLYPRRSKLRVGIVSGFFYNHSNWKIPIKGWMQLLQNEVELHAYYTGNTTDACTQQAQALAHKFYRNLSFEELCGQIESDQIDLLIYPEIGMDQLTARLASHRLAAVQCTSWGHPVTSGLHTIDYFLSSDLMEPHNASEWYREHLIRLPGLSFVWQPPHTKPVEQNQRAQFGLHDDDKVFLCVQNSAKYLPQCDHLLAEIVQRVSDAKLVFIKPENDYVYASLSRRLEQAFADCGVAAEQHVVFLQRLDAAQFLALNQVADVCLDTPMWSGCNSTLVAIEAGLPVVTWPADSMRSRHSSAILETMQLSELVAQSETDYIQTAVRLVEDQEFNQQMRTRIQRDKAKLAVGGDKLAQALLDFFQHAMHVVRHEVSA